jgi:hypothetical protein
MWSGTVQKITYSCIAALFCLTTAHASDCPAPNTPAQIAERLGAAQSAFSRLDSEQFSFSMEEVELMVPCLSGRPAPVDTAQLHRMFGLHLHTKGKNKAATHALLAAKVLSPNYLFPDGFFPEGYALEERWSELSVSEPSDIRAPLPKGHSTAFDGQITRDRPIDRTTLFQLVNKDGSILRSQLISPEQTLPNYESIPRQRNRIIGATIGAGVAAALTYGLAWQGRRQFDRDENTMSRAELQRLRTRVNNLFFISGSLTLVTAAGASAAVLIGPR